MTVILDASSAFFCFSLLGQGGLFVCTPLWRVCGQWWLVWHLPRWLDWCWRIWGPVCRHPYNEAVRGQLAFCQIAVQGISCPLVTDYHPFGGRVPNGWCRDVFASWWEAVLSQRLLCCWSCPFRWCPICVSGSAVGRCLASALDVSMGSRLLAIHYWADYTGFVLMYLGMHGKFAVIPYYRHKLPKSRGCFPNPTADFRLCLCYAMFTMHGVLLPYCQVK